MPSLSPFPAPSDASTFTAATGVVGSIRCVLESDPDALGKKLAVVGGVAEEELRGLGPLKLEMGGVQPRESDPTVDLDVLGGGVEVRVGAVRFGQARDDGDLVGALGRDPAAVA